jgi:curved DNA-binding protein
MGASVAVPTPDGSVQLSIPAGSPAGRKLRLRGKGLPGTPPGDLFAALSITLPPSDNDAAQAAWRTLAGSFKDFNPRTSLDKVTT